MSINHERRIRALETHVSNLAKEIAELRTMLKDSVEEAVMETEAAQTMSLEPRKRGRPRKDAA